MKFTTDGHAGLQAFVGNKQAYFHVEYLDVFTIIPVCPVLDVAEPAYGGYLAWEVGSWQGIEADGNALPHTDFQEIVLMHAGVDLHPCEVGHTGYGLSCIDLVANGKQFGLPATSAFYLEDAVDGADEGELRKQLVGALDVLFDKVDADALYLQVIFVDDGVELTVAACPLQVDGSLTEL